jgi:hypothetical protein
MLHKHFSFWLSTFCNSISIITSCVYATMSKSNITTYVNSFTFFRLVYYVQFIFSTDCLAVFSLRLHQGMYIYISHSFWHQKPSLLKSKLHQRRDYITNIINPYTWLMAWGWRHFQLPATHDKCSHRSSVPNHLDKKIIMYRIHQIAFNQIGSCKFKQWCKFSSCVKAKACEKKSQKMRPARKTLLATLHSNWLTNVPVLCKDTKWPKQAFFQPCWKLQIQTYS